MDNETIRILLIEDDPDDVRMVREMLTTAQGARFQLECADQLSTGLSLLAADQIDIVLLDLWLPDSQGLHTLTEVLAQAPQPPVVVMTAVDDTDIAVKAVREGAQDYLVKGQVDGNLLARCIQYAIERRRAEEALRESEEKFRSLAERSPNMIFINHKGRVVYANEKCEQVLGYKREEFYSPDFDFFSLIAPECIDAVKAAYGKHMKGEEVPPYEYALLAREGERIEVINATRLIKYNGESAILGVVTDITERKRAEEALLETKEWYRDLYEEAPMAYFTVGVDGHIRTANRSACDLLGYAVDELVGRPVFDLYAHTPAGKEKARETFKRFRAGEGIGEEELEMRRADGRPVWISLSVRSVRNGAGRIVESRSMVLDITERKRAEEELEQSLGRLQRMLGGTVNALAAMTEKRDPSTAGHQQGVARLASAIAEEMGLSEERIEGIQVAGIVHDIGKMYVPAGVLNKSGKLTGIEFAMIKAHPQAGYDILKTIEFPWPVAEIVLQHHERMDGSGYPHGLRASAILVEARIIAVADVVEAMVSHRPYRPAHATGEAFEEITENKGALYDSEVVNAGLKVIMERGIQFR